MIPPVVMVSCEQRHDVRQVTLEQFGRLGISVDVYSDPCVAPAPAEVLRDAWHAVTKYQGSGVLYVEDDIDLNAATFVPFVARVVAAGKITTLCLLRHRLYPERIEAGAKEMLAEIVPLRDYDARFGFHGTMCVYLPPEFVNHMANSQHEFMAPGIGGDGGIIEGAHGFDFWVKLLRK